MKILKSKKMWLWVLLVAIIAVIIFWFQFRNNEGKIRVKKEAEVASEAKQVAETKIKSETFASANLSKTYTSDKYRFSLNYPEGLKIGFFQDGNTAIVAISEAVTGLGVQIAITPFDEPTTVITAERVKKDIPDMVIKDPQEVTLGSLGKGIAWVDGEGIHGKRQVWFAARGYLFQMTAPMPFDATLKRMLNTWTFH